MSARHSHTVTFYTRPGCHLCEEAAALLARLGREYPITIVERDVSASVELEARYGWLIPAIQVDGGPELCAPIEEARLRAALRSVLSAES
ncbi:MAG: glutaredoxin family protein [Chloroflexi bacterium]|nr:glutaredoxin family protein [Chloroflexota bacterium]